MIEKGALLYCIPDTDSTSVIKRVVALCRFLTFVALLGIDKARNGIQYSALAYSLSLLTQGAGARICSDNRCRHCEIGDSTGSQLSA